MRLGLLIWVSFALICCSQSDFSVDNASIEPVDQAPSQLEESDAASDNQQRADKEEEDNEYKECLLAVDGDLQSIVSISQGNVDLSQVTPNSVLLLEVQGQAEIDLSAADFASLKGICIFAAGNAQIRLALNAIVATLYYYARGTASATLDFEQLGTLNHLLTDVSGASRLTLTGEQLDCAKISNAQNGAATVLCNGESI